MKKLLLYISIFFLSFSVFGQVSDDYQGGYKIDFNDDGSKYLQIIGYGHFQWQDNEGTHPNDGVSIRRMGVIMLSQINDRFKIVTHLGLSSLNADNMSIGGSDIQLVDLFGEYKVTSNFHLGIGKHYYNGISRMNSLSPPTSLTMDVNRATWSTVGLSDDAVRHLGIFAKGDFGKFKYHVSVNSPITNTSDGNANTDIALGDEKYLGRAKLEKGKYAYAGYMEYQFLDQEANFLPYRTMTYLGAKEVLNLGAGFFYHPDGIVKNNNAILEGKDVFHFGTDLFYDAPIGANGGAINFYGLYQYSKMGDAYLNGRFNGNGSQIFAQAGYLIPKQNDDGANPYRNRFQPYLAYTHRDFNGLPEAAKEALVGLNYYVDGQNAKLTVQYQKAMDMQKGKQHQVIVQAAIML